MKMVKKVLMGLALGAAVFSFVGCGDLLNGLAKPGQGNDTEQEITGTASSKKVGAANDTDTAKRIYDATTLKHSGALVKATFKNPTAVKTGKMGLMFDLKENANKGHDFFIIGVNPCADGSVANFYVSKFEDVTDYQAYNFGTEESTTNTAEQNAAVKARPAKETIYVNLEKANNIKVPKANDDGSISFTIYYKLTTNGDFDWAVLDMADADIKKYNTTKKFDSFKPSDYTVLANGTIKGVYPAADPEKLGNLTYDYYADATKLADGTTAKKQNYIGYYTQIAPKTTLDGEFYIPGDRKSVV